MGTQDAFNKASSLLVKNQPTTPATAQATPTKTTPATAQTTPTPTTPETPTTTTPTRQT
jgi:hypothetical protein